MRSEKQLMQELTKAEQDAQKIRQLEEQIKRQSQELMEYRNAEDVLIAAGLVSKHKIEQAHEIVRNLK